MTTPLLFVCAVPLLFWVALLVWRRLELSLAKAPSLQGHPRIAHRLARLVPYYSYGDEEVFRSDGAPDAIVAARKRGFARLVENAGRRVRSGAAAKELERGLSDLQFTNAYAVPFQYRRYVGAHLPGGAMLQASHGVTVTDLDGNEAYDLTGSYGMNVFGYDFYKACIDAGVDRARDLGPVLGAHHSLVIENVNRLRTISGLDEVSFHMSGTEAVMQAVRLARFHTGRSHLVRFAGAYHGWWDDVQPGLGNPRVPRDTYTLRDMSERSLRVLRHRTDIACVLVNALQALHPNRGAPGDSTLVASDRRAGVDRAAYTDWLRQLRQLCDERGIVLIVDDVFLGFRIARRGTQEYFGVRADLVTYGKTVGGGLPIGVLCGTHALMKRYREDRPSEICFARGTFNGHPYVMASMYEFLSRIDTPAVTASYADADRLWNERAAEVNRLCSSEGLPLHVANLGSIWTICYTVPSRYNWMLQFYLRAEGLRLSWVGTGRLIFSHNFTVAEFNDVVHRLIGAAQAMRRDEWWTTKVGLTDRAIQRQVVKEMVAARLGLRLPTH